MGKRRQVAHYTVEGSGEFPIDMLRYDCSSPDREADSRAIMQEGKRRVNLVTYVEFGPTDERWLSFNWRVVSVTE